MERNYYYVGIAFFGMINGLFNEDALIFALIHMQIWRPRCCLAACHSTLMFSSLMVSTATIILGGIPAAIYERSTAPRTIRPRPQCGFGWPGQRFSPFRRSGNFFKTGL